MKVKLKKVYYCEYCKNKKGLSAPAMSKHEKHCTGNPKRKCRMCENNKNGVNKEAIKEVKEAYKVLMSWKGKDGVGVDGILGTHTEEFETTIKKIAVSLECPACMLAVLRQSNIEVHWANYNYKEEVENYWANKNEEYLENDLY